MSWVLGLEGPLPQDRLPNPLFSKGSFLDLSQGGSGPARFLPRRNIRDTVPGAERGRREGLRRPRLRLVPGGGTGPGASPGTYPALARLSFLLSAARFAKRDSVARYAMLSILIFETPAVYRIHEYLSLPMCSLPWQNEQAAMLGDHLANVRITRLHATQTMLGAPAIGSSE